MSFLILEHRLTFREFVPAEVPYPGLGYSRPMRTAYPAPPREIADMLMNNRRTKAKAPKRMCEKFDEGDFSNVIFQCLHEYDWTWSHDKTNERLNLVPSINPHRWSVTQVNTAVRLLSIMARYLEPGGLFSVWNLTTRQAHIFAHEDQSNDGSAAGFVHTRHELIERGGWAFSTGKKPYQFKEG